MVINNNNGYRERRRRWAVEVENFLEGERKKERERAAQTQLYSLLHLPPLSHASPFFTYLLLITCDMFFSLILFKLITLILDQIIILIIIRQGGKNMLTEFIP